MEKQKINIRIDRFYVEKWATTRLLNLLLSLVFLMAIGSEFHSRIALTKNSRFVFVYWNVGKIKVIHLFEWLKHNFSYKYCGAFDCIILNKNIQFLILKYSSIVHPRMLLDHSLTLSRLRKQYTYRAAKLNATCNLCSDAASRQEYTVSAYEIIGIISCFTKCSFVFNGVQLAVRRRLRRVK